jgi:hypothetical protein
MKNAIYSMAALLSSFAFSTAFAGVCPAVGNDSDCGVIITITDSGASISFTGQGPYDGVEDTLVGVVNNSSQAISALGITSTEDVFSFDGDGIDTYGVPGNSKDGTGYGGPNAYFTNIGPGATSGTVNFITPLAANGGSSFFSLENAISSANSCTSLINDALSGPVAAGTAIRASFTPNSGYSLADAASTCGFIDFNWQQSVLALPLPSPFQTMAGTNLYAPPSFLDPPPGGYAGHSADNSYPYYYDYLNGELQSHETSTTLSFADAPADSCLFGGKAINCGGKTAPPGSKIAFSTHLVGVNANGTPTDLGIGFTWTSNFNGTSGGTNVTKSSGVTDPASGTGSVTILSVQKISTLQGVTITSVNGNPILTGNAVATLKSGNACNGVFGGFFAGDIVVSTGQNCTFENGTITGNVQVRGGSLRLSGALVAGNVQVKNADSFSIDTYTTIKGNVQVMGLSDGSQASTICDSTVYGDLQVHRNGGTIQIGTSSPSRCGGNVILGNLEVHNNIGVVSIFANTVSTNLHDHNNDGATQVFGNTVIGALQCEANALINGGTNSATRKLGQCSRF